MVEQIIGKKSHYIDVPALKEKAGALPIVMDLGTGDGKFAYRFARKDETAFYIGIDADRTSLADASAKAAKKPARGGCPNAAFLCFNLLDVPQELHGLADKIYINFPWGSLMYAVVTPHIDKMADMAKLAKNGAPFEMFLNLYVFENEQQRQDMRLPEVNADYVEKTLIPAYKQAGIDIAHYSFDDPEALKDHPSSWAGRLIRRSGRNTLHMKGAIRHG